MFYFTCHHSLSPIGLHTADADATQLDSCVASASAVCIGHYSGKRIKGRKGYDCTEVVWSLSVMTHCPQTISPFAVVSSRCRRMISNLWTRERQKFWDEDDVVDFPPFSAVYLIMQQWMNYIELINIWARNDETMKQMFFYEIWCIQHKILFSMMIAYIACWRAVCMQTGVLCQSTMQKTYSNL